MMTTFDIVDYLPLIFYFCRRKKKLNLNGSNLANLIKVSFFVGASCIELLHGFMNVQISFDCEQCTYVAH